jgi:osmotically-inducible protein OsmY
VHVTDGIATLEGQVNRGGERVRASEIAEETRGVRSVVNRLTVKVADRSDDALKTAVLASLAAEAPRDFANVSARVEGHRVTLSGSVSQAKLKDVAEKLTWYVPGVAQVDNAIAVAPEFTRTDDEIRADVTRSLRSDPYVQNEPIQVSVERGVVGLSGVVASAFEKRRARNAAEVAGVVEVRDTDVRVVPNVTRVPASTPVNVTDADARAAIRDAFAADPRVPRTTVDFDVKYGVVTLTGVVASVSEKLAAAEDARRAIGVTAVVNQVQVRPWAASGSAGLEQGVLARLQQHPYVDARNVHVRADGTVISLDGSVGSDFERRTAERVAGAVAGVSEVKNQLGVTSGRRNYRDDEELRREVENALYWDRRVGDPKLTVGVVGGVVTVRGEVPNAEVYDAILEDIFELSPARLVNDLSLPARERPLRPTSPQG